MKKKIAESYLKLSNTLASLGFAKGESEVRALKLQYQHNTEPPTAATVWRFLQDNFDAGFYFYMLWLNKLKLIILRTDTGL